MHAIALVDLDRDGLLDIVLARGGDLYDNGDAMAPRLLLQRLDGTFRDATVTAFGAFKSRVRDVAIGDVDANGLPDVLFPSSFGLNDARMFLQLAPGQFVEQPELLPLEFPSTISAARFGDLDGDGDVDLVVADWGASPGGFQTGDPTPGNVRIFWNLGGGSLAPALPETLPPANPASVSSVPIDIDLVDADGNWGLDIIVTMRNGLSRFFYNDGKGNFGEASFPAKRGPYSLHADVCDTNGDTYLDVVLDDAAAEVGTKHRTQIAVNDGAGDYYDFSDGRVISEPNTNARDVKCGDIDGDGDFDLVIATAGTAADEILRNDGTGVFVFVPGLLPDRPGHTTVLAMGDIDADGRLDMLAASDEGSPRGLRLLLGSPNGATDDTPPRFRGVEYPTGYAGSSIPVRIAASDAYAAELGQSLSSVTLTWDVGDGPATVPARFVGGDFWWALVPPQGEGAVVTLMASATDRGGLTAKTDAWMIPVVAAMVSSGGAGGVGGSDAGGAPDDAGGGAGMPDASGSGGADVVAPERVPSGSSAGCATSRNERDAPFWWAALLLALISRRRRAR